MKTLKVAFLAGVVALTIPAAAYHAEKVEKVLEPALLARDRGDTEAVQREIARFSPDAIFAGQLRLATLYFWQCESFYAHDNTAGVRDAAKAGLAAAERAARLQPNSSEAHRLIGDLLGQMIPYVFAGGMRYGRRSTQELETALKLDSRNVNAHIARATSYLFTPEAFGGSKPKALEELKKAIEIDPNCDTAYLWAAQVYHEMHDRQKAMAGLESARRINPNRLYTQYLLKEIGGKP